MALTYGTETKARPLEGHLHACHTGRPPVICRARTVCCAHAFCLNPRRTKIRMLHMEDTFWAMISVLCEEQLSEVLVRLGG